MLRHWDERTLDDLLADHGLTGLPEEPFPNDGWSGATLTRIRRDGDTFILKRTSWAVDWIARATRDHALREGFVATGQVAFPEPLVTPYLGAAADGTAVAILMPDLSAELIPWESPDGRPTLDVPTLDRVIAAIARLHASRLDALPEVGGGGRRPWCPLRERLTLLTRPSAERFAADGVAAGARFLAGWDAFDGLASSAARDLVAVLASDPAPVLGALARLPDALLHGDLKVANVALIGDERVALIDWQMVTRAPVAVELGWLLVSNSGALPLGPESVVERYFAAAAAAGVDVGDAEAQVDLTWIVGLLLRGWRKGLDAEAGARLADGTPAAEDLAWWSDRAVAAARRRLA